MGFVGDVNTMDDSGAAGGSYDELPTSDVLHFEAFPFAFSHYVKNRNPVARYPRSSET